VLWGLAGLVGLVAVPWVVGSFLPEAHTVSVSSDVHGSRAEVWSVLAEPAAYPAWRHDVDRVDVLAVEEDGAVRWRETGGRKAVTYRRLSSQPPRRLVVEIADEDLPYGGRWTYVLEPVGEATRVTITEDGVVHNPLFRFVSRFVIGHDATARSFLESLRARMESPPPHVAAPRPRTQIPGRR
jgi:uncharacterized protein YndB with AHSA1/START domain